ncbi:hypothetical protein AVEN_163004-1 [Araneus ventricosus]|uniref:Uncharacterized protein n=1 Tax=Araneus ventricosus TaxID=182803 RepID=A0A4Y2C1B3_ARAVE|nr:hypothetical protein AVEN_163004-1 [Araneus ventricosus]
MFIYFRIIYKHDCGRGGVVVRYRLPEGHKFDARFHVSLVYIELEVEGQTSSTYFVQTFGESEAGSGRCRRSHRITVQNYDVRPKIALALLSKSETKMNL